MEEAPTPFLSKSVPIVMPKLIKKKEFEIISIEKVKYKVFFEILSSNLKATLLITAYPENKKIKYKKEYILEDIQKVKLFIVFDNLEECLEEIIEGLKMNKNKIINEDNKIILTISLKNIKYKEIIFYLDKEEKTNEETLIDFSKEIESLKKENKQLKLELSNIKLELNKIKNMNEVIGNKNYFLVLNFLNIPVI